MTDRIEVGKGKLEVGKGRKSVKGKEKWSLSLEYDVEHWTQKMLGS